MAPNDWIARRTVWGGLGTVSAPDELAQSSVPGVVDDDSPIAEAVTARDLSSAIDDGTGMIKLDVPHFATGEGPVSISVEVNWSLVLTKAVARLYLVADGNRHPLLASIPLIPGVVPPLVCVSARLEDSADVRAIVECGDGTLLQVRRWVWVMPPETDAP
jgi:predicted secreted protein